MSDEGQEQGSDRERRQRGPDKRGRKRRGYAVSLDFAPTGISYLDRMMEVKGSREGIAALEKYARLKGAQAWRERDGTLFLLMRKESYVAKCIWRQSGRLRRQGLDVHAYTENDISHVPVGRV